MKKYVQYIKENIHSVDSLLEDDWWYAIRRGDIYQIKELINKGINVNIQDIEDMTALIFATGDGNKKLVEFLLQQPDIDVNLQNNDGDNALIYSSFNENKEIVELLLTHPGLNVNLQDGEGFTALMCATFGNDIEIVKILLEHPDIDITIKSDSNKTFFDYVEDKTFFDYVEYKSFLKDYELQKKILDNGREDILIEFNNRGLVDPKIKEENPDLINAGNWGII
jgi:ankyrin repeat protein